MIQLKLRPKTILSLTVLLLLWLPARGAVQDQKISSAGTPLPLTAKTQRELVPPGWIIEEEILGDLNGDNRTDVVLKLLQPKPSAGEHTVAERRRALLILLRQDNGQLRRAAFVDKLLQCPSCGGALYGVTEAPSEVTIVKGNLTVKQERGSRNVVEQTFRFRYESRTNKFWLIGFDRADRDRATGALVEQSTNFLTGQKIVTKSQFDERLQKFLTKSSTLSTVSRERVAIEQVDHEK